MPDYIINLNMLIESLRSSSKKLDGEYVSIDALVSTPAETAIAYALVDIAWSLRKIADSR